VQIAVYPWDIELMEATSSALMDTVVSVGPVGGSLVTRLTRFTVQTRVDGSEDPPRSAGHTVGLSVAPSKVRVFTQPSP